MVMERFPIRTAEDRIIVLFVNRFPDRFEALQVAVFCAARNSREQDNIK
jgi:hypothetical protein